MAIRAGVMLARVGRPADVLPVLEAEAAAPEATALTLTAADPEAEGLAVDEGKAEVDCRSAKARQSAERTYSGKSVHILVGILDSLVEGTGHPVEGEPSRVGLVVVLGHGRVLETERGESDKVPCACKLAMSDG